MFSTLTISQKLAATVTVSVTLSGLLGGAVALQQEYARYVAANRGSLLSAASAFSAAIAQPVASRDADKIFDALRGIGGLRSPDGKPFFAHAAVKDRDGRTLSEAGVSARLDDDMTIDAGDEASLLGLLRSRSISVVVPVIEAGVPVGRLEMTRDASDLFAGLLRSIEMSLAGTGCALALGLGIAMRLHRGIVRPLKRLTEAMGLVRAAHDYSATLPPQGGGEIGVLVAGFNAMLSDIRGRDDLLTRHRDRLEQDVAERTHDLAAARDDAERANAAKSDFLATMSHEIRTPMSGMLVMAELLASGDLPPRSRRYAEVISQSGQALLAIINDILDFAKIESGKMELEAVPVDLGRLLGTVLSLFYARAREKGLDLAASIAPDLPSAIVGDPVRLSQVISNLVGNALKFTERGAVSIELSATADTMIRIAVSDSGIGIARDKIEAIFEAFSQADQSTSRQFGGTGLGLAISNRLVRAMGSQIEVRSEPGQGSTFFFDLQFTAGITSPMLSRPDDRRPAPTARVSVTGPATRRAIEAHLTRRGFVVAQGSAGDATARTTVALSDSRDLRHGRVRPDVEIVVAIAEPDETTDDLAGLADTILTRPILPDDLRETVDRIIGGEPLQRPAAARQADAAPRFPQAKVLGADDSVVNREILAEALARFGIVPTLVENGAEALDRMAGEGFDLVLMDGSMPVLDGFEATRRQRQRELRGRLRHTPIVALTAHVVGTAATAWRDAGMDASLSKPFTMAELQACLSRWLEGGDAADTVVEAKPVAHGSDDVPLLDAGVIAEIEAMSAAGGGGFAPRVMTLYRAHAPDALRQIGDARSSSDHEALAAAAHALKSMSHNVGAAGVAHLAGGLERSARSGHAPSDEEVAALQQALATTLQALPYSDTERPAVADPVRHAL